MDSLRSRLPARQLSCLSFVWASSPARPVEARRTSQTTPAISPTTNRSFIMNARIALLPRVLALDEQRLEFGDRLQILGTSGGALRPNERGQIEDGQVAAENR